MNGIEGNTRSKETFVAVDLRAEGEVPRGPTDCADDIVARESEEERTSALEFERLRWPEGWEEERARRIYRGRTIAMLRRYLRYSIETGRLPSLLGREFFRSKVTSYTVVTFEDRVIFVHDMETCLDKLDEFSRELIARHVLQEHDLAATARLLACGERTVRRFMPIALDVLSEILLEVGLMDRLESKKDELDSEKNVSRGFSITKVCKSLEEGEK